MLEFTDSTDRDSNETITELARAIRDADTVIIGAGAGLSTSAGFVYNGERFEKYFSDFEAKYGFHDMYSGGFHDYETKEEFWAFFSRMVWVNRYMDPPGHVYQELLELVKDKDYFVITTNVDHCFQKAGFDKKRLFYTQGDYGLFQCSVPCHNNTYDNEETIRRMIQSQGYEITEGNDLVIPEGTERKMTVPGELFPVCPVCGEEMTINLRGDDRFVEDRGWHIACDRYRDYLQSHKNTKTLFLELGVGMNTPVIIKYPFWNLVNQWPDAMYACVNLGEAYTVEEIKDRSVCINDDIGQIIHSISTLKI